MGKFVFVRSVADLVVVDGAFMSKGEVRKVRAEQAEAAMKANPEGLVLLDGEPTEEQVPPPPPAPPAPPAKPLTPAQEAAALAKAEKAAKLEAEKAAKEGG